MLTFLENDGENVIMRDSERVYGGKSDNECIPEDDQNSEKEEAISEIEMNPYKKISTRQKILTLLKERELI